MFNQRFKIVLFGLLSTCLLIGAVQAGVVVLSDDFEDQNISDWTITSGYWGVLPGPAGDEDSLLEGDLESAGVPAYIEHSLSETVTDAFTLECDYGWWAGVSNGANHYWFMLDSNDEGYAIRINSQPSDGTMKYYIYRMDRDPNEVWIPLSTVDGPEEIPDTPLRSIKATWNGQAGTIVLERWEEIGGVYQWVEVISATDTTYTEFTDIRLGRDGWLSQNGQFDNLVVTELNTFYTLTVETNPGIVTSTAPEPGSYQYLEGGTAYVTANRFVDCPDVYAFDHWEGDIVSDPGEAQATVVMDSNKTITAVYVDNRTCGDECYAYPVGDYSEDCVVGPADLGILAGNWLVDDNPQ